MSPSWAMMSVLLNFFQTYKSYFKCIMSIFKEGRKIDIPDMKFIKKFKNKEVEGWECHLLENISSLPEFQVLHLMR